MTNTKCPGTKYFLLLVILLLALVPAGCGRRAVQEDADGQPIVSQTADEVEGADEAGNAQEGEDPDAAGSADEGEEPDADEEGEEAKSNEPEDDILKLLEPLEELTEEELAALQYVEKTTVADTTEDHDEYEVYAPKDAEDEDGVVVYNAHGLTYTARAIKIGYGSYWLELTMRDKMKADRAAWESEDSDYTDVKFGGIIYFNKDEYCIATAVSESDPITPCAMKKIYYLDIQGDGVAVLWTLEMLGSDADDETDAVIDEIAKCYCVNLDRIKSSVTYQDEDDILFVKQQDVYVPFKGEPILEKLDGYQYMGLGKMEYLYMETQCPVMAPLGWETHATDISVHSDMHGVEIRGELQKLYSQDFLTAAQSNLDTTCKYLDNVQVGEMQTMDDFHMARSVVLHYDGVDMYERVYVPQARVICYFEVLNEYMLEYAITLSFEEYDSATDALLKELEVAYGIDLSEFYYENVK